MRWRPKNAGWNQLQEYDDKLRSSCERGGASMETSSIDGSAAKFIDMVKSFLLIAIRLLPSMLRGDEIEIADR
jgi:hypothetical protein